MGTPSPGRVAGVAETGPRRVPTRGFSVLVTLAPVRRSTEIPSVLPIGLSDEFSNDPSRQKLWSIFLAKSELPPRTLPETVTALRNEISSALHKTE